MKTYLRWAAALALLLAAPWARAGATYTNGDVLLIFRESGLSDVEYDLGNISQFTNSATNAFVVTNLNLTAAVNAFGPDLTGVSVILVATTSQTSANKTAWVSSAGSVNSVSDVTPTTWQGNLWSVINSVGSRPGTYLPTNTFPYSLNPASVDAYDYIVSGAGQNEFDIPQLGGNVSFTVEQQIPGLFNFWAIQPHANPQPAASQVGWFYIDAGGNLTFFNTPPQPGIQSVERAGNLDTVSFSTLGVGSYSLVYTNELGSPFSAWPVVSGPISGNGGVQSLSHTTSDTNGFYGVLYSP